MRKVHEGIYQLVTPFPEYQRREAYRLREELPHNPHQVKGLPYVLPYFIVSNGENLLVDCGWNTDDAYQALKEQLNELGSDVSEVRNLAITHSHPDHCGLVGRIKKESGCAVWMHENEVSFMRSRYVEPEELIQRMKDWARRHGVPSEETDDIARSSMPMRFFVAPIDKADVAVKGGEHLKVGQFVFEVIWTPGHSPGHICLYEPNHRLLLTGDHILPLITPNISLHPEQRENPLQDYLDSLQKVANLKVDRILPAHEWDVDWFQKRLHELMHHHEERLEEMVQAIGYEETVTAATVAQRIRWNIGSYEELSGWMRRAAIGETLAHLRFLARQGRLKEVEMDGVVYFARA